MSPKLIVKKISIVNSQFNAFTLVELMISISIIAILTAAAIPSFTDFSKSQTLIQNFKTLKSDLRIAQSRSISGSTVGGAAKAWGIYFDSSAGSNTQYIVFACPPAITLADYLINYVHTNPACVNIKTVNLGSQVKISNIAGDATSPLSLVFDAQNGGTYVNGKSALDPSLAPGNTIITLSYTDGSSPKSVTITAGGGISD